MSDALCLHMELGIPWWTPNPRAKEALSTGWGYLSTTQAQVTSKKVEQPVTAASFSPCTVCPITNKSPTHLGLSLLSLLFLPPKHYFPVQHEERARESHVSRRYTCTYGIALPVPPGVAFLKMVESETWEGKLDSVLWEQGWPYRYWQEPSLTRQPAEASTSLGSSLLCSSICQYRPCGRKRSALSQNSLSLFPCVSPNTIKQFSSSQWTLTEYPTNLTNFWHCLLGDSVRHHFLKVRRLPHFRCQS